VKLVDTSVWIDYWRDRTAAPELTELLVEGEVLLHPWVLGELALGNLGARRASILADLARVPASPVASDEEVLGLIDRFGVAASGLGWVDVQLVASAKLSGADLWTHDRRLAGAWRRVR
jgi:predicted nucleic acid-binding protein